MFKNLVKVGLIGIMALTITACTSDEEQYLGKWTSGEYRLNFMKDNQCLLQKVRSKGVEERVSIKDCSWKILDGILVMTDINKPDRQLYFKRSSETLLSSEDKNNLTKDKADIIFSKE